MNYSKYLIQPFRMEDDEPDAEPKEEKSQEMGKLMVKKMEKYFFETRSVD